jgi:hypothetical protein
MVVPCRFSEIERYYGTVHDKASKQLRIPPYRQIMFEVTITLTGDIPELLSRPAEEWTTT